MTSFVSGMDKHTIKRTGENAHTEYSISKELTQFINAEYQNYLAHKERTIKMAKDFVANLIKHEEEFNFSSLEKSASIKIIEGGLHELHNEVDRYRLPYFEFLQQSIRNTL